MEWWAADHDEAVVDVLEHGERLKPLARTMLERPATAWWFDSINLDNQVWISHDKVAPDTTNWQRPKSPPVVGNDMPRNLSRGNTNTHPP